MLLVAGQFPESISRPLTDPGEKNVGVGIIGQARSRMIRIAIVVFVWPHHPGKVISSGGVVVGDQ